MRPTRGLALFSVAVLAAGCKGSTGPSYPPMAGNYSGPLTSAAQGLDLGATMTLAVTQTGRTLGGTYTVTGTIINASTAQPVAAVQGSGALSGNVGTGDSPSVTLSTILTACPGTPDTFTGSYDDATRVVTLNGSLDVFDAHCQVTVAFPLVIVFSPS